MNGSRYRISSISIEGFRGFTSRQTILLEGKNAFIFGQNGQGKSSIVEAIRWCLFASPGGRDIEVRNTFYAQKVCGVDLVLTRNGTTLHIRRELRPGAQRSRLTITNESGESLREQDALPQLARIGHQQGTQVIFAAQQAIGRQSQIDVTDFTRVLCFYLNVEVVPDTFELLKKRAVDYSLQAEELARELDKTASDFRGKLSSEETKLSELLRDPPWGKESPPTATSTSAKIKAFVLELARLYGKEDIASGDQEAMRFARAWLEEAHNREGLKLQAAALRSKIQVCQTLVNGLEGIVADRNRKELEVQDCESRQSELLKGASYESISKNISLAQLELTLANDNLALLDKAAIVLGNWKEETCPLCGDSRDPVAVLAYVKRARDALVEKFPSAEAAAQLSTIIHELDRIAIRLKELRGELDKLLQEESSRITLLCRLLGIADRSLKACWEALNALKIELENILKELADADAEKRRRQKQISDLETELVFHAYRTRIEYLRHLLEVELQDTREQLKDYRDLLATMKYLTELIETCFNDVLDRAIPPLNEMMTDVYHRLTGQVSYESVEVVSQVENRSRRELRVATSRVPSQTFPVNVLNGQAAKAIQLVPYFVFSQFQPAVMELDLLLIDDPSESFDTSHVGRLIDILSESAKHAQLIVATHEKEKFESRLSASFDEASTRRIDVLDFDPIQGPRLAA